MKKPLFSDLIKRTVEEGECLLWTGYSQNGGRDPNIKSGGKKYQVRRVIWSLLHGCEPRADYFIGARCGTLTCIRPEHLVERSRSQAFTGTTKTTLMRAKVAATKRKVSTLTQQAVQEIRLSPLCGREEAAKHGISKDMVNRIRAGRARRDYGTPFAGLGTR